MLYVHPFAEELNKSRRMAALAARAFAAHGWLVLQVDGFGCGDSSGDFGDAAWQDWIDDLSLGRDWLRSHCAGPLVIWSLRAGSLLASDWMAAGGDCDAMLLWQPLTRGRDCLHRFLRLAAAASWLDESDGRAVLGELKARIEAGEAVEVAGYTLSPSLVEGMVRSTLQVPERLGPRIAVLEVTSADGPKPSAAASALAAEWRGRGLSVELDVVHGVGFWQTQEIENVPVLIEHSVRALSAIVQ